MTSLESGTGVTPARQAALEMLAAVERGQRVDRAFADSARDLDPRERAWCRELVYGVQRLRGRLDYLLDRRVRRGLASVDPEVLDVLRLGVYQILYMDGVPEYAAVSQTVDLARAVGGKGAAGFVNAIMRATVRERPGQEHFPDFESDFESDLESVDLLSVASLASLELSFLPFFDEYRSEYQPLPFRTNEVFEINFLIRRLLHSGQVLIGSSVMRCSISNSPSHFGHSYS